MALRQILTEPNKILRQKSTPVDKVDSDIKKLVIGSFPEQCNKQEF